VVGLKAAGPRSRMGVYRIQGKFHGGKDRAAASHPLGCNLAPFFRLCLRISR
jgi:hypothetical protein